jgi:hypothetical protein
MAEPPDAPGGAPQGSASAPACADAIQSNATSPSPASHWGSPPAASRPPQPPRECNPRFSFLGAVLLSVPHGTKPMEFTKPGPPPSPAHSAAVDAAHRAIRPAPVPMAAHPDPRSYRWLASLTPAILSDLVTRGFLPVLSALPIDGVFVPVPAASESPPPCEAAADADPPRRRAARACSCRSHERPLRQPSAARRPPLCQLG